jgi:hypothetical protein
MGLGDWLTMFQKTVSTRHLGERIKDDLKKQFQHRELTMDQIANREAIESNFIPDLVIRHGDRVAVIQVKTGDPSLPLPSSANSQMLILKEQAARKLANVEIVPVIITNYRIDEADRTELADSGIEILSVNGTAYDSKLLSGKLKEVVEGQPTVSH